MLDEVTATPTGSAVRTLAEATLAVVLFADASRIKPRVLRREYAVPLRLLGIGLPLTIALGALLAALIFDQLTPHRSARAGNPSRPDRCRPRRGGGDRATTPVTDPAGAQRREPPQRRHLRPPAADRARRGRRPGQIGQQPPRPQHRGRGDRLRDPGRAGRRVSRRWHRGAATSSPDHGCRSSRSPARASPTASRPRSAARASSPRSSRERSSARSSAKSPNMPHG